MKIFWHLYKNQKKINLYRYFKGNWSKFILKQKSSNYSSDDGYLKNYKKNEFDFNKIHEILSECNLEPKFIGNEKIRVKYCPLCPKPHNEESSNLNTLIIYNKGIYHCYRCGNKGNFVYLIKILKKKFDFKGDSNNSSIESSNELSDIEVTRRINYDKIDNEIIYSEKNNVKSLEYAEPTNKQNERNDDIYERIISPFSQSIITSKDQLKIDSYRIKIANTSLLFEMYKRILLTENEKSDIIMNYIIEERKLTKETIKHFQVGVSYEKFKNNDYEYINLPCVSFPMFYFSDKSIYLNIDKNLVDKTIYDFFNCDKFYMARIKIRAIGKEFKHFQKIEPTGALIWGLFGINTIPSDAKEIVITEGEFDAMAVWQELRIPTISLPNGASSLPVQLLPYFQRFEKIYLWMDADQAGKIASENFSKKLGQHKTFVVNTRKIDPKGPKDANDALKEGKNLREYIDQAKPLSGENILKLSDIKLDVLQYLTQYDAFSGYKTTSFDFYNKKIKGLRMGEFDILTGETGSGKTTFLAQLSLDFLIQRESSVEEIEYYLENLEKLPLYLMKFYGSSSINEIINTMEYAVYHYDIQNIVLDNLQFMMGIQAKSMNKFDFQDEIIHRLRKFTTDFNVHVTLVIHPRKTDEALTISSIFGSAKASQEADNVFIMQNYKGLRIIEVAKNRFDGTTGKAVLSFQSNNCRFFELSENEFVDFTKNDKKIENIIQDRINKYGSVEPELSLDSNTIKEYNHQKNESPEKSKPMNEINESQEKSKTMNEKNGYILTNNDPNFKGDSISQEIFREEKIEPIEFQPEELNGIINEKLSVVEIIDHIKLKHSIVEKILSEKTNQDVKSNIELMQENKQEQRSYEFDIITQENNLKDSSNLKIEEIENNSNKSINIDKNSRESVLIPNKSTLISDKIEIEKTPNENFDQINSFYEKILPEVKFVDNLHTEITKDKSRQLSQNYGFHKRDNNNKNYYNKSNQEINNLNGKKQFNSFKKDDFF